MRELRHARTKTWVICDTYHSQNSCINTEKSPIHTFKQPFIHLNVWYKACHTTIRRAVKSPFVIIFYFFLFIWYTWGRRCEPVSCQFKSCSTIFFNFLFLIFWYAGGCRSEHVPCQTAIRRAVDFFVFLFLFVIFWYAGGRCCKRAPCHTTIRRAVASFLFLFSIIVWFGMQKGAATHVSHVTQELLNFFFFVHYCFDWYAGERRYICVPCHKRIRNANWKFFLLIYLFFGMQEGAAVNVSHVTHQNTQSCWKFVFVNFIFFSFFSRYAGGRRCERVPCYSTIWNDVQTAQGCPRKHPGMCIHTSFCKRDLQLVALLRKMTCNLRHPMGLRHPIFSIQLMDWDL